MKKPRTSTPAHNPGRHDVPVAPAASATIPAKWQLYYRKLQELRDTLLAQNRNLLHEAREPVGTAGSHVAESGTDEFERGLHFSLLATEQNALHEVEAALHRIETGTFGICAISGERIPAARLKVVPWTRYTAAVEGERERERKNGRAFGHPVRNGSSPVHLERATRAERPAPRKNGATR